MGKEYCVYILTNAHHTVLYTGVTSNPINRIYQHRMHVIRGFTARYNVEKLVYLERHADPTSAIMREKPITAGSRTRKVALINAPNPEWRDLYGDLVEGIASAAVAASQ